MFKELLEEKENINYIKDKFKLDPEHFRVCIDFLSKFMCFKEFKVINTCQQFFLEEATKLPLADKVTDKLISELKGYIISQEQRQKIEQMISRYLIYSFFQKVIRRMVIPLFKPILFLKNAMNGRGPISQLLKYFSSDTDEWILKLQDQLKKLIHDPNLHDLITTKPGTKRGNLEDELLHGFKSIIKGPSSKKFMPQLEIIVTTLKTQYPIIFDELPNSDPNTIKQSIRRCEKSNFTHILQGT